MSDERDLASRVVEIERRLIEIEKRLGGQVPKAPLQWTEVPRAETTPEPSQASAISETPARQPRFDVPQPQPSKAIETRIGTEVVNRVGVVAIFFGVAYFLKLAFDNGWIGPEGRVIIGLVAGVGLMVWSERFRARGYVGFSNTIKAVGFGVLYLSLWAAFQRYNLIPAPVAFSAMIAVTVATVWVAIRQSSKVLALLAFVGAYLTPALVSTGRNEQFVLFSYLIVLCGAIHFLARARGWHHLFLLAFPSTVGFYVAWASQHYSSSQFASTLTFASILFVLFAISPFTTLPAGTSASGLARSILALLIPGSAVVFLIQAAALFDSLEGAKLASIAVAIALLEVVLFRLLVTRPLEDGLDPIPSILLLTGLFFITIAIPIELEGHAIRAGWLIESALLILIGLRLPRREPREFGVALLALAIFALIVSPGGSEHFLLNQRFANYLLAILILGTAIWKLEDTKLRKVSMTVLCAVVFFAANSEIGDLFGGNAAGKSERVVRDFIYSATWIVQASVMLLIGFKRKHALLRYLALGLFGITVAKVFAYDLSELERGWRVVSFMALGVVLLAVSWAYQRLASRTAASSDNEGSLGPESGRN